MEIKIGVSNRHVHLTEEVYNFLFDESLEMDYELSQPGQFASKQRLTLMANGYEINNVRILGPLRSYNQVEISHNDALKFNLNPPVNTSGDLTNAEFITLRTSKSEITLKCCIIAQRHIHISPEKAQEFGVVNDQKVQVQIDGSKSGIVDAYIKLTHDGHTELHVDTDDANAFLIAKGTKGNLLI